MAKPKIATKGKKGKVSALATPAPKKIRSFDEAIENDNEVTDLAVRPPTNNHDGEVVDEPMQETGLARYSNTPSFDASDLFIPKLRLAQGLTSEVQSGLAKPGDWLVLGSDAMKSPTIIPVLMTRRRELRDTDDNRAVLCRSADSVIGVGNPGGECASCPMNRWVPSNKPGGKNSAPPCTFIYSYIVYLLDTEELCVLEFYRTSIPAGKMLNTMIMQKGLGNFGVQLKANSQQGPRGTYYSPSIVPAKVPDKVLSEARSRAAEMF